MVIKLPHFALFSNFFFKLSYESLVLIKFIFLRFYFYFTLMILILIFFYFVCKLVYLFLKILILYFEPLHNFCMGLVQQIYFMQVLSSYFLYLLPQLLIFCNQFCFLNTFSFLESFFLSYPYRLLALFVFLIFLLPFHKPLDFRHERLNLFFPFS